jgi:hypothetical protein
VCSKGEGWSHIQRCEGTKISRDQILNKRFRGIGTEIAIRIVGCRSKDQWQKIGMYMIKYEDKWERILRKNETEAELNLDE